MTEITFERARQQPQAVGAAPGLVGVGEHGPDVAHSRRPQQRINDGMADDVGVTVALQAATRHAHAAEHQAAAGCRR